MRTISLGFLFFACSTLAAFGQSPSYKLARTVELGAPDSWDYVVFDSPRVYVARSAG